MAVLIANYDRRQLVDGDRSVDIITNADRLVIVAPIHTLIIVDDVPATIISYYDHDRMSTIANSLSVSYHYLIKFHHL